MNINQITMDAPAPLDQLTIVADEDTILRISISEPLAWPEAGSEKTPLLAEAERELNAYFKGELQQFSLPLAPAGTVFQKNVWQALTKIPYGTVCTYKDIAVAVDCPKGFRAVGLANNKNPIPILIPCHRVIGANGSLVGFAGGVHLKEYLLGLEGVQKTPIS